MDLSALPSHDALRFGRFELQPLRRRLLADGEVVGRGGLGPIEFERLRARGAALNAGPAATLGFAHADVQQP
jgi:hypothetical protein